MKINLEDYDFSAVNIILLYSKCGKFTENAFNKYGINRFKAILEQF